MPVKLAPQRLEKGNDGGKAAVRVRPPELAALKIDARNLVAVRPVAPRALHVVEARRASLSASLYCPDDPA